MVDAAVDPTAVVDPALRVLHVNRPYLQLAGLRRRDMRTAQLQGMCHNHFRLASCEDGCIALRAWAKKKPIRVDQTPGANNLSFIVTAIPLVGLEGSPAIVESYRDVTAESRMQESYRSLLDRERRQNEILQEQVRLRTDSLSKSLEELKTTRMQLVQSEKMSALGMLMAGIAHEINNPVNFIYANMDFLEEHTQVLLQMVDRVRELNLNFEQERALEEFSAQIRLDKTRKDLPRLMETMRSGTERIASIVRDLRTFSHGGTTKYEKYDLDQAITMTLRLVVEQSQGRVELRPELGGVRPFLCQGPQVNQVIMNLVVNAIQAIHGSGVVWVRSKEAEDHVEVEVQDTGEGISHEILDKIFDPFFTTRVVGKGTGLGLAISQRIVTMLGGRLDVSTEVGKGSTFRALIPKAN